MSGSAARAALAATLAGAALVAPAADGARTGSSVTRAVGYIDSVRNADGGVGAAVRTPSSTLFSGWAALGLRASGRRRDPRLGRFLARDLASATTTGDLERSILALDASGRDVPVSLRRRFIARRRSDGSFDRLVNLTAFGVFALRTLGRRPTDPTVATAGRWIAERQHRDGGYGLGGPLAGSSGVDTTGAALEALVASGSRRTDAAIRRAVVYLVAQQHPDGGFGDGTGGPSNAQSTAFAVQGLIAAGRDPERVRSAGSRSPLGYLRSLQVSDGSIRYSRTSGETPVWVTAQALLALARQPLPLRR